MDPLETWRNPRAKYDSTLPQFVVNVETGLLPRQDPLVVLPDRFAALENLLDRMPIKRRDGKPGLLSTGQFGDAVKAELPVYDCSDIEDMQLLAALYRDFTFAASAYLLEPCDVNYRAMKQYGLGRDHLPKSIAIPLTQVANKIGAKPFMEYALSYALYNWKRLSKEQPLDYKNLDLIREFSGSPSERGFILVHVAMVRHSSSLVKATLATLDGRAEQFRSKFNIGLTDLATTLTLINGVMETMWVCAKTEEYQHFRTFIMGTKNQPMFPNGVVYEGVSEEPQFYRGESGANDSMIPTVDNLLQLTEAMPSNALTDILKDFRTYRPSNHSQWVAWVADQANNLHIRKYAQDDPLSSILYLKVVDCVRNFRLRHWSFTKEYILKYSDHPVATGGSPIVTWLPNQLRTVLEIMQDVAVNINDKELDDRMAHDLKEISERVEFQLAVLDREVTELKKRFPDQERLALA